MERQIGRQESRYTVRCTKKDASDFFSGTSCIYPAISTQIGFVFQINVEEVKMQTVPEKNLFCHIRTMFFNTLL